MSARTAGDRDAHARELFTPKHQVAYCLRCARAGRQTELVFGTDAIGRMTERCPVCDRVASHTPITPPDSVLRPQSLIDASQLLPPCPVGVLRCQGCAYPVVGTARLCTKCELPGLEGCQS